MRAAVTRPNETNETPIKRARKRRPTGAQKAKFLDVFRRRRCVTRACRHAGISRATAYRWRDDDPDFARDWDEAQDAFADELESLAFHRALHGWNEPVFYEGNPVGRKRRFSPGLLIFMLKCNRPERYALEHQLSGATAKPEDFIRESRRALAQMRSSVPTGDDAAEPDVTDGEPEVAE